MRASELTHKQQQAAPTRVASYFSARERLLNRDHDSSEPCKLAHHRVRAARVPHTKQQQQQAQVKTRPVAATVRMDHQEQPSEKQTAAAPSQQHKRGLRNFAAGAGTSGNTSASPPLTCERNERTRELQRDDEQSDCEHDPLEEEEEEEASQRLAANESHMTPEQVEQNKQHVGPVMGIFFKVWSLVKVTRMRHNKMRRQNSEDVSQFHFISGDQLASTSGAGGGGGGSHTLATLSSGASSVAQHNKHVLRDAHFRRAGSQPPLSTSQHEYLAHSRQSASARLQVRHQPAANQTPPPTQQQQQPVSTTNSSSSGVSSATSNSLAGANSAELAADLKAPAARNAEQMGGLNGGLKAGARSWTARIKSRASVANSSSQSGQQSYMSRYRFRRADPGVKQINQDAAPPSSRQQAGARQLRSHSELQQLDELKKRSQASQKAAALSGSTASSLLMNRLQQQQERIGRGQRVRSFEHHDDGGLTQNGHKCDELAGAGANCASLATDERDEEEDSDLNDIYSTPNDSIQSVPSSQLLLFDQRRASATNTSAPLYPMVKSYSSQSFSQALRQTATNTGGQPPTQPTIDERNEFKASSSSSTSSSKTTTNSNTNKPQSNSSQQIDSLATSGRQLPANGSKQRLNGSRFFISSSSSEDSQTPNSYNGNQLARSQQSAAAGPDQLRAPIPIHFGLHHHEQLRQQKPARPNSLMFPPPATMSSQLMLSPSTANSLLAEQPVAIAAMSPAFAPQHVLPMQLQQFGQPLPQPIQLPVHVKASQGCYKKSPSLFAMSSQQRQAAGQPASRFSSKYPAQQADMSSFLGGQRASAATGQLGPTPVKTSDKPPRFQVPNSISLHDCKLANTSGRDGPVAVASETSEYKMAQMLLRLGSNPAAAKDQEGCTALMHSILSENLSVFKCLLEHGVDLNEANHQGQTALDLIASKAADELHLEMFNLLIDNRADFDKTRHTDGTRLLDRLIGLHEPNSPHLDKLAYIDCLLHNGAKLASSTWLAAAGKHQIQLRLLKKLCQDGYFLYKKSAIEAAIYRFEYALKRIDELEQQLATTTNDCCHRPARPAAQVNSTASNFDHQDDHSDEMARATQQVKYQTYLGLSRCERRRKFYRRALEFAHMSILVDSTSYEGYYSKAHILKDLGELDDSLLAIDQTDRLVNRSIEHIKGQLSELANHEESIVFDACFQMHEPNRSNWIEAKRAELVDNLEYLEEAKRHIARLRGEILDDKLQNCDTNGAHQNHHHQVVSPVHHDNQHPLST